VAGGLALGLAGFLASRGTRTVTVTVVAPAAGTRQGAPVVVTIDPAREDGLTPFKKFALSHGVTGCGTERAAVKHVTDGFVLPTRATVMTPEQLVSMAAPPVTQDSPRFPVERKLVALVNVRVIAVKQEADSDLHVLLTSPTGAELNVEAPQAQCESGSPYVDLFTKARQSMDAAMPNASSSRYTAENFTATIEGVLFFDVLHGQRGAPNGVELHPVTYFSALGGPAPHASKRRRR
jgi:hypothetical protein